MVFNMCNIQSLYITLALFCFPSFNSVFVCHLQIFVDLLNEYVNINVCPLSKLNKRFAGSICHWIVPSMEMFQLSVPQLLCQLGIQFLFLSYGSPICFYRHQDLSICFLFLVASLQAWACFCYLGHHRRQETVFTSFVLAYWVS